MWLPVRRRLLGLSAAVPGPALRAGLPAAAGLPHEQLQLHAMLLRVPQRSAGVAVRAAGLLLLLLRRLVRVGLPEGGFHAVDELAAGLLRRRSPVRPLCPFRDAGNLGPRRAGVVRGPPRGRRPAAAADVGAA